MKILCVCLSATVQRTIQFDSFSVDSVNRSQNWREDVSGKALNAARVLNQLEQGCSVAICPVGNANAEQFMVLASRDNDLYLHPVYVEGNTRECWTLLDTHAHTTTEIVADEVENIRHLAGAEAELALIESVREYMSVCDALLFAGSRPAAWSANICERICDVAHKAGKLILADFRGKDLLGTLRSCVPQIIKINEEEYCQTFCDSLLSEKDLESSIVQKSKELDTIIVVTRGTKDTIAAEKGTLMHCPIESVSPLNTTACGDTFAAGFLHDYLLTGSLESALKSGTHCAAINATTLVPGSLQQLSTN